mmetsp:Transcript_100111/g.322867  ORF Transcript_100111/g.322867 Transcript_100111/m.322867 type:complete len:1036 (+) Transcript_100111:87-3194(+)
MAQLNYAALALLLCATLIAARRSSSWQSLTGEDEGSAGDFEPVPPGDTYGDAVQVLKERVLPLFNSARQACGSLLPLDDTRVPFLLETDGHAFSATFQPPESESLTITFRKDGKYWGSWPAPCDWMDGISEDAEVEVGEKDELVQKSIKLLVDSTARRCGPEATFSEPKFVAAFATGGTLTEQLELYVESHDGKLSHRLLFEWETPGDGRISVTDVPLCELSSRSSLLVGTVHMLAQRRQHKMAALLERQRETRRARSAAAMALPRLPSYTGKLEKDFNWQEERPSCFPGVEVQDQGSCGSCWAFASLGALSDRHCVAKGARAMSWQDGELKRFSVQDFLSCYKVSKSGEKDGCNGGNLEWAYHKMMDATFAFERTSPYYAKCFQKDVDGVVNDATEEGNCEQYEGLPDHPHNNKPCSCWKERPKKHPDCKADAERQHVQASWGSLKAVGQMSKVKREELIKRLIREGGPVATGFKVWEDFKQQTSRDPTFPYRRYAREAQWKGGHAVVITGWGETENGEPYWWVRNSWGSTWALNGYFKVLRGENSVGFEDDVAYPVVEDKPWQTPMSRKDLGLRPEWDDTMVPCFGSLKKLPDKDKYAYKESSQACPPIKAIFRTDEAVFKKDFFSEGSDAGSIAGVFQLLAVQIPFSCSAPCIVSGSYTKYKGVNAKTGEPQEKTRRVSSRLDDDSWTKGIVEVVIDPDDPLNGAKGGKLELRAVSPLKGRVETRLQAEGISLYDVDNWYSIPDCAGTESLYLPTIPRHVTPSPPARPLLPLNVLINNIELEKPDYGTNSLVISIDASEESIFNIRISDKATGKEFFNGRDADDGKPSKWAWPSLGGYSSLGGKLMRNALQPYGIADGKLLLIEVTATCSNYAEPITAVAEAEYQVPAMAPPPQIAVVPVAEAVSFTTGQSDYGAKKIAETGQYPKYYAEQSFRLVTNFPVSDYESPELPLPRIVLTCSGHRCPGFFKAQFVAKSYHLPSRKEACPGDVSSTECYPVPITARIYAQDCDFSACKVEGEAYNALNGERYSIST